MSAHRLDDPDTYCLLGDESCIFSLLLPTASGEESRFVRGWLDAHPRATAIPISGKYYQRDVRGPKFHTTYIWIEDGKDSLNIELVRNGFYKAEVLEDMVDHYRRLGTLQGSGLAEADAWGPARRLISASEYAERMVRAKAAELEAQRDKVGLWSDAEMKRWNPPTDTQMIWSYQQHKRVFARIESLLHADERLIEVNWDPKVTDFRQRLRRPATAH